MDRAKKISGLIGAALTLLGCATEWKDGATFHRTVQNTLSIQSSPVPGSVFLNNKYTGQTPLTTAVECQQEVKQKTRHVTYWETHPGLSLLLSITSLGLYVPFSLIPADPVSTQEAVPNFKDNEVTVRIEADGYKPWQATVLCGAQDRVPVDAQLERQ
jgi:hypothetical protein